MAHQICLFSVCILCAVLWQSLCLGSQEGACLLALCWLCWGTPEDKGDDTFPEAEHFREKPLDSCGEKQRGVSLQDEAQTCSASGVSDS